mgnify:CR=1 FL=1
MSFDQDPNEQAQVSAADFAMMCDEMKELRRQRDALLEALERIRKQQETIGATGNSAWTTADFAIAILKGQ